MSSPFVCEICGADITIGRHRSGWRHTAGSHFDHRVKKIGRKDYKDVSANSDISIANIKMESKDEKSD